MPAHSGEGWVGGVRDAPDQGEGDHDLVSEKTSSRQFVNKGVLAQQHRFPNYHALWPITQIICLKTPRVRSNHDGRECHVSLRRSTHAECTGQRPNASLRQSSKVVAAGRGRGREMIR
jgi:hypothetical protein